MSVLTIGNFDGVHLGHRALIRNLTSRARAIGAPAVVMTFEPHPVKVLYPDRKMHRIFDFDDQREQLASLGVDLLVIEPFSREFSQLPPDRYLRDWILTPFHPDRVVVGHDFNFGANRQGSIDFLVERAKDLGFQVEVVPAVKACFGATEIVVSSSRIRQALVDGDVKLAAVLLDRPFYLKGLVEKGAGRGKTIGIPTANLNTNAETIPARGVYCAWATVHSRRYPSVVNIGLNPTFVEGSAHPMTIEAHLLGYPSMGDQGGDFYGEILRLDFVERLRDEKKFSSPAQLIAQIHSDIQTGLRILGGR
jgi:riboflavin kinase/FMN adenylyltransferase